MARSEDTGWAPDTEALRDLFYFGHLTRYTEERLRLLLGGTEEIGNPSASVAGNVAAPVAASLIMNRRVDGQGDVCSAGPHGLGAALAFGATPLEYFRQCAGRGTGPSSGRTPGLHWTDRRRGLFGSAGIPGTMTQVMAGVALALKHRGEARVALSLESRTAPQTGGWHEGVNLAAAQAVPLIVVLSGETRPASTAPPNPPKRGEAYGYQEVLVPSGDLIDVCAAVAEARTRALAGGGVTVIDVQGEDGAEPWSSLDRLGEVMRQSGHATRADLDRLLDQAVHQVDHAATRVEKEPEPHIREALQPVVLGAQPVPPWTRQGTVHPAADEPLEPKGEAFGF